MIALHGEYTIADFRHAFSGQAEAQTRAAQRFVDALPDDVKRQRGDGRWVIDGACELPGGGTVLEAVQGRVVRMPDAVANGPIWRRDQWIAMGLHVDRADRFCRERGLSPTTGGLAEYCRVHREQLAADRLPPTWKGFARWTRRYRKGEPLDKRPGRSGRPKGGMSPEAWELFLESYLGRNQLPLREVWRFVEAVAEERGWVWPNEAKVRARVKKDLSKPELTLYREGERAFDAKHGARIQRDYWKIEAGAHWVFDCRVLDIQCRALHSRQEWVRVRPVVSAVMDMRSRMLVGWAVGVTESSDLVLSSVRMAALEWGLPAEGTLDNGSAYKAAAGRKGKGREYLRDGRVMSAFGQLGIEAHWALPFKAWAKPVERLFGTLKNGFDRWFSGFWGGKPDERPEGADRWMREHIMELPTLGEVREHLAVFVDELNSRPHRGRGMLGMSPREAMEQFRGTIRRVDERVLNHVCRRFVGPRTVTNQGTVSYQNIVYGAADDHMLKFVGRAVWLALDPQRADRVTLCERDGTPLCEATNRILTDTTREDLREANRVKAAAKRDMRRASRSRGSLFSSPTQEALAAKRRRQVAEADARRKQHAPPPEPDVSIVRPDLVGPVQEVEQQAERGRARRLGGAAAKPAAEVEDGFELLARLREAEAAAARPQAKQVSIEDLYSEVTDDDWGTMAAAREAEARKAQEEFDRIYGGAESPREAAG